MPIASIGSVHGNVTTVLRCASQGTNGTKLRSPVPAAGHDRRRRSRARSRRKVSRASANSPMSLSPSAGIASPSRRCRNRRQPARARRARNGCTDRAARRSAAPAPAAAPARRRPARRSHGRRQHADLVGPGDPDRVGLPRATDRRRPAGSRRACRSARPASTTETLPVRSRAHALDLGARTTGARRRRCGRRCGR